MENPTEDIKLLRNYVLGVVGFATAVSAVLIEALHFRAEPTIICVIAFACMMLLVAFLINKSEKRQAKVLEKFREENEVMTTSFKEDLTYLKDMALENQRSAVRAEMDNEIFRNPANHDTIIKYAYRYFKELDANWVQTEKFLSWADNEKKAGRPVHLPSDLVANVNEKVEAEKIK